MKIGFLYYSEINYIMSLLFLGENYTNVVESVDLYQICESKRQWRRSTSLLLTRCIFEEPEDNGGNYLDRI